VCNLNFWGATTSKEGLLLDQGANCAVSVVKGALGLVQDEVVGASADNGNRVGYRLDARNLDVTGT
jgi:hypothetical protein